MGAGDGDSKGQKIVMVAERRRAGQAMSVDQGSGGAWPLAYAPSGAPSNTTQEKRLSSWPLIPAGAVFYMPPSIGMKPDPVRRARAAWSPGCAATTISPLLRPGACWQLAAQRHGCESAVGRKGGGADCSFAI